MNRAKTLGIAFVVVALVTYIFVWITNSRNVGVPIVFSDKGMLASLWSDYKNTYIEAGTGRALDRQQKDITTSEGQSYALLQAVWMDDKVAFDQSFKWALDNLKRDEDNLFSWLFGERADGTFAVLVDQGGYNSATDADTDIALALLFAHKRWNEDFYLDTALSILEDVWEKEVIIYDGKPYLTANNLEKQSQRPIINPSYFSPYAYRIFAQFDTEHDWMALVDTSYEILETTSSSTLDKATSAGLPPNWVALDRSTGSFVVSDVAHLKTDFGYDALRVLWRVALDYQWNNEPRAKAYLERLNFLSQKWCEGGILQAVYSHDGNVVDYYETPAMYGGTIGYFMITDPVLASEVYERKLKYLFDPDTNSFKYDLSYYDANWAWFGLALYTGQLPNLAM